MISQSHHECIPGAQGILGFVILWDLLKHMCPLRGTLELKSTLTCSASPATVYIATIVATIRLTEHFGAGMQAD